MLGGRVATEIDGLRRALGSSELTRIPPHVTLVPPRNVSGSEVPEVFAQLRRVAAEAAPLRLSLGPAATFAPRHEVVYLAVAEQAGSLGALVGALSSGPLAPPVTRPARAFVPHVTITNRAAPEVARAAVVALAAYRQEVTTDALSVLEADLEAPRHPWRTLARIAFGGGVTSGRGGLEVVIDTALGTDPEVVDFVREQLALEPAAPVEAVAMVLTARVDRCLVGVIAGECSGASVAFDTHLVAAASRSLGIGTRLLNALEREALARRCSELRTLVPSASAAVSYYEGRGFRRRGTIAGTAGVGELVLLVRALAPPELASRELPPSEPLPPEH